MDVAASALQLQLPRVNPPVFKGHPQSFLKFQGEFLQTAKSVFLDHIFLEDSYDLPIADPKRTRISLSEEYDAGIVEHCFRAWNFLVAAFPHETDKAILASCHSPKQAFEALSAKHCPTTESACNTLLREFNSFTISKTEEPLSRLRELEVMAARLQELEILGKTSKMVYVRFLDALPREYSLTKMTLGNNSNFDRGELVRMVSTQFDDIKKGLNNRSRGADQALVAKGDSRGSGSNGRNHNRSGGGQRQRGRGQGGGGQRGGSPTGSTSSSATTTSTRTNSSSSSSSSGSSGNGGNKRRGGKRDETIRCHRCNRRGHIAKECSTAICDFVPKCDRCGGVGHKEDKCPSDEGLLAFEILTPEEEAAVDAGALVVRDTTPAAKCSLNTVCLAGVGEQARQGREESFVLDSGATSTMFASDDCFTNYRECDLRLKVASNETIPITGKGDVVISFRAEPCRVELTLHDVLHVPELGYNLISHFDILDAGHEITQAKGEGAKLVVKNGEGVIDFPFVGKLTCQYGYRVESSETACATIAPGVPKPPPTPAS